MLPPLITETDIFNMNELLFVNKLNDKTSLHFKEYKLETLKITDNDISNYPFPDNYKLITLSPNHKFIFNTSQIRKIENAPDKAILTFHNGKKKEVDKAHIIFSNGEIETLIGKGIFDEIKLFLEFKKQTNILH